MEANLYKPFEIHNVPSTPDSMEHVGTKYKFWYVDSEGEDILFKMGRDGTGENWAEIICAEICTLIGLPHAKYYLAKYKDMNGVISPKFNPKDSRLVLGNEALERFHEPYDGTQRFRQSHHTVRVVVKLLSNSQFDFPNTFVPDTRITSTADLFLGYLALDVEPQ